MRDTGVIGFSQRVQLPWMAKTANMVLAGMERKEIVVTLQELLQDKLSIGGTAQRGNRGKTISILMRIWLTGRPEWPFIREKGLGLIADLPDRYHLPVHWGMTMAVYPFFGAVAEVTGRLLQLQGTVSSSQIQRRLCEWYGERETVIRATQRVMRVFVDWGVVVDTKSKGQYGLKGEKQHISHESLTVWLLMSRLAVKAGTTESIRTVIQHPSLFPFQIDQPSMQTLKSCKEINLSPHGFGNELLVSLPSDPRKKQTK